MNLNTILEEQQTLKRKSDLTNVATTIIMIDEQIALLNKDREELIAIGESDVIDIKRVQQLRKQPY